MTTPMPLPDNSRKLRTKRYEAWIGHSVGNGVSRQDDTGSFATMADAEAWVAATHPDAEKVFYTLYFDTDGWRPHRVVGSAQKEER